MNASRASSEASTVARRCGAARRAARSKNSSSIVASALAPRLAVRQPDEHGVAIGNGEERRSGTRRTSPDGPRPRRRRRARRRGRARRRRRPACRGRSAAARAAAAAGAMPEAQQVVDVRDEPAGRPARARVGPAARVEPRPGERRARRTRSTRGPAGPSTLRRRRLLVARARRRSAASVAREPVAGVRIRPALLDARRSGGRRAAPAAGPRARRRRRRSAPGRRRELAVEAARVREQVPDADVGAARRRVGASSSSSSSASVAVNGFVIEATRKRVPGSQPTAAVSTAPPTEIPTASAGTSQSSAAASQMPEKRRIQHGFATLLTDPASAARVFLRGELRPG